MPQRRHQLVPAPPVGQPGPAHLPVVAPDAMNSARVSWSKLLVCRSVRALAAAISSTRWVGNDEPAQPQAGCQALAGRPGVDDVLRAERLHGADRLAVVAELAVVVVLDDQPAGPRGPFDRLASPAGGERHAERELVRRGEQHRRPRPEPAAYQSPSGSAGLVHRHVSAQPVWPRCRAGPAGRTPRWPGRGAPAAQRLADQPEALGEARADHDPVGVHAHAAGPGQVAGQGLAQFGAAAGVGV